MGVSDYCVGFFAVKEERFDDLRKKFVRAAEALDRFEADYMDYADDAYLQAREWSDRYEEVEESEEVEALTSFGEILQRSLGNAFNGKRIYSPDEANQLLRGVEEMEDRLGGEKGVVELMYEDDRGQDIEGLRRFYGTFKKVLQWATDHGCAFAYGTLG